MKSFDSPSSDASGAAVARQPERPGAISEQTEPPTPDREGRIAELREQYQRGTYQVDAAELSSSILEKHLKR